MIDAAAHLDLLINRAVWVALSRAAKEEEERKRAIREELYRRQREAEGASLRFRDAFDRTRPAEEVIDEQERFRAFVSRKSRGKRKRGGKRGRRRAVTILGTGRTVLTRRTDPDAIKARGR